MIEREQRSTGSSALSNTSRANVGFVLSHEQFPANQLVEFAPQAEAAGFDALSTSDHFQPWQANEGHVGMAWVTLAAVGQRTQRVPFGTGVTCPSYRYNPAIVAEAFATLGLLYPGRVFLGVGTGEALNEVTAGGGWGHYRERADRLIEAVQVIRALWTGETVNFTGRHFAVKNARLYDLPSTPVPIYIAAEGPKSARLAGEHGDGLITDSKSAVMPEIRQAFEDGSPVGGQRPEYHAHHRRTLRVYGGPGGSGARGGPVAIPAEGVDRIRAEP